MSNKFLSNKQLVDDGLFVITSGDLAALNPIDYKRREVQLDDGNR